MSYFGKSQRIMPRLALVIGLVLTPLISLRSWVFAQSDFGPLSVVRSLATSEFGANGPKGLAFSAAASTFLLLDEAGNITLLTMGEEPAGNAVLSEVQDGVLNVAFDDRTGSLFVLHRGKSELARIQANDKGLPDAAVQARSDVKALNLGDPQGLAIDSQNGLIFVLDAASAQIVAVAAHPALGFDVNEALRANQVRNISLANLGTGTFRGLAYNPSNGYLYVSELEQKKLYELTQAGDLVSTFDLASVGINNLTSMTFAPSVDNTDDPNIYDLFLLDATPTGSQLVELSLQAPMALPAGTTLLPASLVRKTETSTWSPPSPDPAGVDYLPGANRLVVVDSEVDEMPIFSPDEENVFLSTTSGNLTGTCSTMSFTNEPTGVGVNPNNQHIFISTDMNDRIFEVDLVDGVYCNGNDIVTATPVSSIGATDVEDVAYGNNTVFIADGVNAEVYVIPLGGDGVLGAGDLGSATHFDTLALGFTDLEGIGYNPDPNPDTLFIVSTKGTEKYLGETTISGALLRAYDLALMGAGANKRSDLTYAPSSQGTGKSIYIASRNIDNNSNANENDGQIWEINISVSGPGPTATPTNPPPTGDLIFSDGFETADVDFVPPWSASKTDAGDLSIQPAAAMAGSSKGMQAVIDDTVTIFVTSDHPNAEPRYRARFYFDPNSITMTSGNAHHIFIGIMGTSTAVMRVEFRFSSGAYQIRGNVVSDAGMGTNTPWVTISDAPHFIEVDWRAATAPGANNGGLTLWIDNVQQGNLTNVDNDTRRIDRARLGAVAGIDSGTRGTYYFDHFESRRQNMIGP